MDQSVDVLNDIYKNASLSADSVSRLIPKVKDDTLSGMMASQLGVYQSFIRQARKEIEERGGNARDIPPASRFASMAGVTAGVIKDSSPRNVAKMLVDESGDGIAGITKALEKAPDCDASISSLASELISFEQRNIDRYTPIFKGEEM